jgi:hypothetical protein
MTCVCHVLDNVYSLSADLLHGTNGVYLDYVLGVARYRVHTIGICSVW